MAESQREAISLALNSTKLNATNSLFREDPSLVFSIVTEARDQTLPGSLLARETLGTRLVKTDNHLEVDSSSKLSHASNEFAGKSIPIICNQNS